MEILKLKPVVKDYIWGGTRLRDEYGAESSGERAAEAWMLSCHPDGRCKVDGGEFDGKSLPEVLTQHPEYMGTDAKSFRQFPVMVKLIDAAQPTSVQVHPDDEYAAETSDGQGKFELWYIIDCAEDSEIIYGFKEEMTQEQLKLHIERGTLEEVVERIKVKPGDVFMLEPGTVHAVGAGILLAEIQQNANSAYRLYDYNRIDDDGYLRTLQIRQAIDVAITTPPTIPPGALSTAEETDARSETLLGECDYFRTRLLETFMPTHIEAAEDTFSSVVMIDGEAKFYTEQNSITLKKGDSAFIPAGMGKITVSGQAKFLLTTI